MITITESTRNPYFNMVFFDKKKNLRKLSLKNLSKEDRMLQNFLIFCTVGYMLNKKLIKQKNNIFDCDLNYIKIPKTRAIDIDDKEDFLISKILYEKQKHN